MCVCVCGVHCFSVYPNANDVCNIKKKKRHRIAIIIIDTRKKNKNATLLDEKS